MSSQAAAVPSVVGAAVVGGEVVAAAVVAGGLGWLSEELVPQLVSTQSRATAASAADADRRARRSFIWVFS
ncbi:MAG TPA: hypothetical protein VK499_01855 [Propionibacteriaceae bacterium]|nr:hypothetical protein [Propionibacteriaceae bacterium]